MEHATADAVDAFLPMFLAENDAACPGCGYNLRGLTGRVCPECAQSLRLMVALQEPRLGMWIAGVIGTAAGAGFNGLLLIYVVVMMAREGGIRGGSFMVPFLAINLIGLLVQSAALILWLRFRRRYRLSPRWARVVWVVGAWILSLVDLAVFAAAIK